MALEHYLISADRYKLLTEQADGNCHKPQESSSEKNDEVTTPQEHTRVSDDHQSPMDNNSLMPPGVNHMAESSDSDATMETNNFKEKKKKDTHDKSKKNVKLRRTSSSRIKKPSKKSRTAGWTKARKIKLVNSWISTKPH